MSADYKRPVVHDSEIASIDGLHNTVWLKNGVSHTATREELVAAGGVFASGGMTTLVGDIAAVEGAERLAEIDRLDAIVFGGES